MKAPTENEAPLTSVATENPLDEAPFLANGALEARPAPKAPHASMCQKLRKTTRLRAGHRRDYRPTGWDVKTFFAIYPNIL